VSLLEIGNVRCVPSVHGRASYAALAEREILRWRPGVVAVEIAGLMASEFLRGVRELPRIQAVCLEPASAEKLRGPVPLAALAVLDPADSIVAAARRALAEGIPVECIDVQVDGDSASPAPPLADELLLEREGLDAYYRLFLERGGSRAAPDAASLVRERTMAEALAGLARAHPRVLCVLGMAHWERVRALLSGAPGPAAPAPPPGPPLRAYRADVRADALPLLLRQWPWLAAAYERRRHRGAWRSVNAALADLIVESRRRADLPVAPGQLRRVARFVRRVAESRRRLTPRLGDLLVAARGLAGREYARHLFWNAMSYPQPPPEGGLPIAVPEPAIAGPPRRVGRRILIPRPAATAFEGAEGLADLLLEVGADEGPGPPRPWGYQLFLTRRAENEQEDRVAHLLLRRLAAPGRRQVRVREFRSGLRAGLDARRTALDALTLRRTFVRDRRRVHALQPVPCGAVLIDFRPSSRAPMPLGSFAKDCVHGGPKYWKVGLESAVRPAKNGWLYGSYGALGIIFETARSTRFVHDVWFEELADAHCDLDVLAAVVFRHAPRHLPGVVFVAPRPPGELLRHAARCAGRALVWIDRAAVTDLLETIPGFHRRVDDESPDAE